MTDQELRYCAALRDQIAALQSENAELREQIGKAQDSQVCHNHTCNNNRLDLYKRCDELEAALSRVEADIKLAASGRCCQICSRDCLGHEEIMACDAFEYRDAQGVE